MFTVVALDGAGNLHRRASRRMQALRAVGGSPADPLVTAPSVPITNVTVTLADDAFALSGCCQHLSLISF